MAFLIGDGKKTAKDCRLLMVLKTVNKLDAARAEFRFNLNAVE